MDNLGRLLIRKETGLTPAPLKGVKNAKPKDSDSHRVLGNSGVQCESEEPEPNEGHRCFNPTPLSLGGERSERRKIFVSHYIFGAYVLGWCLNIHHVKVSILYFYNFVK